MNHGEATKFLALIKIAYPKAYRNIDNDSVIATINMWQKTFADVPYVIMEMALDHYRRTSEFEPTVASMYKELKGLYYTALEDVMISDNQKKIEMAQYIMNQTSRFKDGADGYEINYSNLDNLIGNKENPLLEGGQADGS